MTPDAPAWLSLGIPLCLFGERLYRLAVVAPGLMIGAWAGAALADWAKFATPVAVMLSVGLAALGALVCWLAESVAVRLAGSVLAAAIGHAAWAMAHRVEPWWGPPVAGLLGLLLFPAVWKALLKGITAALGAVCVGTALGWEDRPWWVAGLALVGWGVQVAAGKKET